MENNNLYCIENDFLKVKISSLGAEIVSIIDKRNNKEIIFEGDDIWKGHFHNIFPICGRNKDNIYSYKNKEYKMNLHGFAKDEIFDLKNKDINNIIFFLKSNDITLKQYPFIFELDIEYRLINNQIIINYIINNLDNEIMYYSIGLHPGFNIPIKDDNELKKYKIIISNNKYKKLLTNESRLIKEEILINKNYIPLDIYEFNNGGLIYEINSDHIYLKDENDKTLISFHLDKDSFPYLVLYTHKNSHFICIEPWSAISMKENESNELTNKKNIFVIKGKEKAYKSIALEVY